jgi:uncharacterized protein YeaO (DUF488 family)
LAIHCVKDVFQAAEAEDGCRLIIMRRYPRGIAKSHAHAFLPQLAPTLPLVHWYHDSLNAIRERREALGPQRFDAEIGKFWRTYSRRYLAEMKKQRHMIEFLASMHAQFNVDMTLLCACADHRICHRSLLAELIETLELRV